MKLVPKKIYLLGSMPVKVVNHVLEIIERYKSDEVLKLESCDVRFDGERVVEGDKYQYFTLIYDGKEHTSFVLEED